ncbi:MAG: sensor histidine kinase [Actinomycetota bacterium]
MAEERRMRSTQTGPEFIGVPKEFRDREVSNRAVLPLIEAAREREVSQTELLEGSGYSIEEISNPRERISWNGFRRILSNLGRSLSDEDFIELGDAALKSKFLRAALLPAYLFHTIPEMYLWVFGPNGSASQLFVCHDGMMQQLRPGHLRFKTYMRSGYEPSRENYLMVQGTLRGLSKALGAGPANVSMEWIENGAVFDIIVPKKGGALRWMTRAFQMVLHPGLSTMELKRANAELLEQYTELQREIEARARAERERASLSARLMNAERMESLGKLAGGVAHDFNNLLAVIKYFNSMIAKDPTNIDLVKQGSEKIQAAAENCSSLTRQLLIFGRRELANPRPVDVNEIVTSLVPMLRRTIGSKVEIKTQLEEGLPAIFADPGAIEQLILNLAFNARDAIEEHGAITLETKLVDFSEGASGSHLAPARYVQLNVSDSGAGMTDDVKQHALDPFFTTKKRGEGTGLGLSTVPGLATQAGGGIDIESAPGDGTQVIVHIPVYEANEET